jgi:predicted ester cyclase
MKPSEVARAVLSAIEAEDFARAESLISDQLSVEGVGPMPLGKKEFLGVHRALATGIPDFSFNFKTLNENGSQVQVKLAITGTHTHEMKSPVPGLKNVPATGRAIKMPEEKVQISVDNDKIVRIVVEPTLQGGLHGLLRQIGVEIPRPVAA